MIQSFITSRFTAAVSACKAKTAASRVTLRVQLAVAVSVFALGATAIAVVPRVANEPAPAASIVQLPLEVAGLAQQAKLLDAEATELHSTRRIAPGDSVNSLLRQLGVDDAEAAAHLRSSEVAKLLFSRNVKSVSAETQDDGSLDALRVRSAALALPTNIDSFKVTDTVLTRTETGFDTASVDVPVQRIARISRGIVRSSLFQAADEAQIPDAITVQLAEIFSGDIDFYSDLRKGDEFHVAYEMLMLDGEVLRPGRLLGAVFMNKGKRYEALWYQANGASSGSYYTFNGDSLRRAFLRAPLEFSRISSGFGGRMHPIHQQFRMHKGVDYAAPTGTPVRATGDGVVKFAGRQGGYGNVIELEHRGDVSTLFAHLNGFAPSVKKGAQVKQGEIIGFVGTTGWSTGPHLHYEYRVKGEYQNPLTVALAEAAPIDTREAPRFAQVSTSTAHRLVLAQQLTVARAQ